MAVTKNDLYFYLTGSDPFTELSDTSQSIGGYTTRVYSPTNTLSADVSIAAGNSNAILSDNSSYVLLGNEICYANTTTMEVTRGALSTTEGSHASGEPATVLDNPLFNNSFSETRKQYRCIAVKNINSTFRFKNLKFYIKNNSLTANTQIDLAIEVPPSDLISGTADNGTIITVVDSILTAYEDNYFADAVVTVTSGNNINQERIIISSDQASGTIVLDSALPFRINTGDEYTIQSGPSQRLVTGTVPPAGDNLSDFVSANNLTSALDINVSNTRTNGSDLYPGEVIYLWIRRSRSNNVAATLNNRLVISAHYRT